MAIVNKSKEYRDLAQRVMKGHDDLRWIRQAKVRIGYCASDSDKKQVDKLVFADCRKVPDLYKAFIPYDFIICVYEPNAMLLTDEQKQILMYHELLHCGIKPSGELYVVPHDVEEFDTIIDKYGLHWAGWDGDPDGT